MRKDSHLSINNKREILKLFTSEVRTKPVGTANLKVVCDNYVTRLEGAYNFICSWTFTDQQAQRIVAEQANYFRQLRKELMWRVYDHDGPSNIEECLRQEGFIPKSNGTFMVLPLDGKNQLETDLDIRQINTLTDLEGYLSVTNTVFDNNDTNELDYYKSLLSDSSYALFSGYIDDEPVASGFIQMPASASFGLLFAGSERVTCPTWKRVLSHISSSTCRTCK